MYTECTRRNDLSQTHEADGSDGGAERARFAEMHQLKAGVDEHCSANTAFLCKCCLWWGNEGNCGDTQLTHEDLKKYPEKKRSSHPSPTLHPAS